MPAHMVRHGNTWTVSTPNMVHGRHMTEDNAKKQMNLLNGLEHGWKPDESKKKKKAKK